MSISKRAVMIVVLMATGLFACSQLGALGDALEPYTPKIRFKDLSLKALTFTDIEVDFVFVIDNPNPLSVKLDTFSYALGLAGVQILDGASDEGIKLEARGESEMALPVRLQWTRIYELVKSVSGKDKIGFALSGDFGFNTPVGVAKVPFKEEGEFPVIHAPDVSLDGLRLGKLDILSQTATVNLDLGLANPGSGSALSFSGLDYKIDLGTAEVAGGVVEALPQVAAGAKQTVTIPLNLNLRSLGSAIVSAVTNKTSLDVKLGATVQVGTPFGVVPLSVDESGNLKIN